MSGATTDRHDRRPFVFKMRAHSAVHLRLDDHLMITWPDGATAYIQSEYTGGESGRAYPVTLYGVMFGDAESVDAAQLDLSTRLGNALPVLALAANAAIAAPLPVAVHGLDVSEPQEFVWYATPDATAWFPPGNRKLDVSATLALMTGVGHHSETESFQRAIEAYRNALANWFPENMLMAGEFLWIAAETLSRVMIEGRARARGITSTNLARAEGMRSSETLRMQYLLDHVFAGDSEAREALEVASNGFEHGYMSVSDVRASLVPVLDRAIGLLRRTLIKEAGVEREVELTLLGERYEEPRSLVPQMYAVLGQLALQDSSMPVPSPIPQVADLELYVPLPVPHVRELQGGQLMFDFTITHEELRVPPNVELKNLTRQVRIGKLRTDPAQSDNDLRPPGEPPAGA